MHPVCCCQFDFKLWLCLLDHAAAAVRVLIEQSFALLHQSGRAPTAPSQRVHFSRMLRGTFTYCKIRFISLASVYEDVNTSGRGCGITPVSAGRLGQDRSRKPTLVVHESVRPPECRRSGLTSTFQQMTQMSAKGGGTVEATSSLVVNRNDYHGCTASSVVETPRHRLLNA